MMSGTQSNYIYHTFMALETRFLFSLHQKVNGPSLNIPNMCLPGLNIHGVYGLNEDLCCSPNMNNLPLPLKVKCKGG